MRKIKKFPKIMKRQRLASRDSTEAQEDGLANDDDDAERNVVESLEHPSQYRNYEGVEVAVDAHLLAEST